MMVMLVKELLTIHCSTGRSQMTAWHWSLITAVNAAVQSSKVTTVARGRFSVAHSSDVVPDCAAIFTPSTLRLSSESYWEPVTVAMPWFESI